MSLFSGIFARGVDLPGADRERLAAWRSLPDTDLHLPLDQGRFVVVDVETTGLSLARDRLIAIGAVAVRAGRIDLGDSFEIILQQEAASSKDNILIHGIGGTAQTGGVTPVEAMLRFLEYMGKDPLIAFHVTFDETMIKRALKDYLGLSFRHPWVDLAYAVPALYPELSRRHHALDDWMGRFGIRNFARHSALADALATAELFLVASEKMKESGAAQLKGLMDLEKAQRWVNWAR